MAASIASIASAGAEQTFGETQKQVEQETSDVTKEMFLQLLVAQIRHQDPLNPSDGTQFLTQLAEFTNLEQTIAIQGDVEAIRGSLELATASNGLDSDGQATNSD
jgi:flagellar basal-body rod modification protein FlgD